MAFTEKEILAIIKETMADNEEVVAWADKKVAQIEKKAEYNKTHKSEKKEKDYTAFDSAIVEVLTRATEPVTATRIALELSAVLEDEISFAKVTPRLKKMIEDGTVTVEKKSKKTFYSLTPTEEEEE